MERVAIDAPLRCYGLEYQSGDLVCRECKHASACQRVSYVRRGKVPLSRVEFNLVPESLEETQVKSSRNVEKLYQTVYTLVYPNEVPDSLFKHKNAESRLNQIADELGCSLRLYMLCCMLARRTLSSGARFMSSYLFAKNSEYLVREYASMARDEYGAFDYESLGKITEGGDELTKDTKRIRDSEVLAGRWVVGYKIKRSGSPLDVFYAENEIRLDPVWLSIEPSYIDYHNRFEGISAVVNEHRMEVRRVRRWMQKRKTVAVSYCDKRSRLFIDSVAEVLAFYGYKPDDFESPPIVYDAMKFWSRLALAIQHVGCLRANGLIN